MNPTLLSSSLSPLHAALRDPIIKRRELLIFRVGQLNMTLPVESVHKILHYTAIHGSETTPVGIDHLADREITVIDLYKRLFKTGVPIVSQQ
jgi:purine-binding chemotaxis protein CheW